MNLLKYTGSALSVVSFILGLLAVMGAGPVPLTDAAAQDYVAGDTTIPENFCTPGALACTLCGGYTKCTADDASSGCVSYPGGYDYCCDPTGGGTTVDCGDYLVYTLPPCQGTPANLGSCSQPNCANVPCTE